MCKNSNISRWLYIYYNDVATAYKMIGNAVPVNLAKAVAGQIKNSLEGLVNEE